MNELRDAQRNVNYAKTKLADTFAKLFPLKGPVTWKHGRHIQTGVVVSRSSFGEPTLWAMNDKTGKEVRVTLYAILSATEEHS